MLETLTRLWQEGKLTLAKLDVAVAKGFITAEQKAEIITSTL